MIEDGQQTRRGAVGKTRKTIDTSGGVSGSGCHKPNQRGKWHIPGANMDSCQNQIPGALHEAKASPGPQTGCPSRERMGAGVGILNNRVRSRNDWVHLEMIKASCSAISGGGREVSSMMLQADEYWGIRTRKGSRGYGKRINLYRLPGGDDRWVAF